MKRIKEITRKHNSDFYNYPEGKSEIEVGVFDTMLMEWFHSDEEGIVHSFANIGRPIPLISYLYHEYIGMVGGIRVKNKDFTGFENPDDFRLVSALIWAWGNKPYYPFVDGRKSSEYVFTKWKEGKLDPVWEDNLKYLANLVKMYKIGKDAMFFGKMLRPPRITGVGQTNVNLGGMETTIPTIVTGAFAAEDSIIYIPITNWGEHDKTIIGIDFSDCKWMDSPYNLWVIRGDSKEFLGRHNVHLNEDYISVNIHIKKGEAIYLVVEKIVFTGEAHS